MPLVSLSRSARYAIRSTPSNFAWMFDGTYQLKTQVFPNKSPKLQKHHGIHGTSSFSQRYRLTSERSLGRGCDDILSTLLCLSLCADDSQTLVLLGGSIMLGRIAHDKKNCQTHTGQHKAVQAVVTLGSTNLFQALSKTLIIMSREEKQIRARTCGTTGFVPGHYLTAVIAKDSLHVYSSSHDIIREAQTLGARIASLEDGCQSCCGDITYLTHSLDIKIYRENPE